MTCIHDGAQCDGYTPVQDPEPWNRHRATSEVCGCLCHGRECWKCRSWHHGLGGPL